MEKERENRTRIIGISIAVVALIVIGSLLAFCQSETELQRKIDKEISQLGTGDQFKSLNALIRIGEPAVPALIEALQNKSNPFTRRWEAAKALGVIKDERAVEPLIKAMSDENEVVRRVTAEALGRLGDTRAIPALKKALRDPKYYYDKRTGKNRYYTRESAAKSLKKLEKEIPLTTEKKAKTLYTLGENYRLNKMYPQAIGEYEKLIKEYPKTTWAEKASQRIKEIKAK